jgi:hypothetical protein
MKDGMKGLAWLVLVAMLLTAAGVTGTLDPRPLARYGTCANQVPESAPPVNGTVLDVRVTAELIPADPLGKGTNQKWWDGERCGTAFQYDVGSPDLCPFDNAAPVLSSAGPQSIMSGQAYCGTFPPFQCKAHPEECQGTVDEFGVPPNRGVTCTGTASAAPGPGSTPIGGYSGLVVGLSIARHRSDVPPGAAMRGGWWTNEGRAFAVNHTVTIPVLEYSIDSIAYGWSQVIAFPDDSFAPMAGSPSPGIVRIHCELLPP